MKKLFITAMIAIAIGTSSFAATTTNYSNNRTTIGYAAQSNDVSLKITDNFKKATFLVEGQKVELFYAIDGSLIGISKTFDYEKLPKSAIKFMATNYAYPSYDLKECIVFENANNVTSYYVSLVKDSELVYLQIDAYGSVSVM